PEKIIIGLIGRIGSGKTAVADHIVGRHGARYLRFSDVLRDILHRVHQPNTRENLQNLGLALRKTFGDGVLADIMEKDVMISESRIIVVDGIRYDDEFDMVKRIGGKVVYVTAPEKVRYERTLVRGTRGEGDISLEQFKASGSRETERQIDSLGARADYRIDNDGSLEELERKTDVVVESLTVGT
ncbi:MAG: AAA family ATPase, partial [Candidatus Altiarchaeota archaeon]|nr:AAA family ATPase [Candidatus Altiarchaeota archaeon]